MRKSRVIVGATALVMSSLYKPVTAASYNLVKEYAGKTFFDDWTFYDHCEWPHFEVNTVRLHLSSR